ncbi:cyclic nucleotide-binding domain-containing protein [Nocardia higoensis]|uniref:Cyclic nucleotide-binding domain-containing protein n=1 Tax=Nocardia higoensis TaxID=228599 RepID=A0ABS0D839_9NOCA|nr:cyclic nucleotide-binding domain-containing protein [Nocardia higoensis]MBF6353807.1 cyclic nucleotide-binding domain-containing protein [Nocardia higoensis]
MPSVDELAAFPRLAPLSRANLAVLAAIGHEVSFRAGQRVLVEGQSADRCWLIRSGRILLDARVPGRGDVVIQSLGKGDLLGWSWLVPPQQWHFGARAAERVEAVEFDAARLLEAAQADPGFGFALISTLFAALLDRLQATRARLLDLYRNPGDDPPSPERTDRTGREESRP